MSLTVGRKLNFGFIAVAILALSPIILTLFQINSVANRIEATVNQTLPIKERIADVEQRTNAIVGALRLYTKTFVNIDNVAATLAEQIEVLDKKIETTNDEAKSEPAGNEPLPTETKEKSHEEKAGLGKWFHPFEVAAGGVITKQQELTEYMAIHEGRAYRFDDFLNVVNSEMIEFLKQVEKSIRYDKLDRLKASVNDTLFSRWHATAEIKDDELAKGLKRIASTERAIYEFVAEKIAPAGTREKALNSFTILERRRLSKFEKAITRLREYTSEQYVKLEGEQAVLLATLAKKQTALLAAVKARSEAANTAFTDSASTAQSAASTTIIYSSLASILAMVIALATAVFFGRHIGTPLGSLTTVIQQLADGRSDIDVPEMSRSDEIGTLNDTLLVFRENAIEREKLRSEGERNQSAQLEKQAQVDDLISQFRGKVGKLLEAVGNNADRMEETSQALNEMSEATSERATSAAGATEEAAASVQIVAAASEELSASVEEIARQVAATTETVSLGTESARASNKMIASLSEAAQRVGDVVSLISDIAEQTNLLALNATIEAARAGEAGRGFAVVADEVKSLATQTGKATEDIADQVKAIQDATQNAVTSIEEITNIMEQVNKSTIVISTTVQQQSQATSEITNNAQQASSGTQRVAEDMSGVTGAVDKSKQSAGQVFQASGDVKEQAGHLRQTVDQFLTDVAAV